MKFILFIFCLLLFSCASRTDTVKEHSALRVPDYYPTYTKDLEDSTQTLDLIYIAWACDCANWITKEDERKYNDTGIADHCVFVEPAENSMVLPDTLGYSSDIVRFTGKFYKDIGYPKNYEKTEEQVSRAKVFRYTKYKVIESNYRYYVSDTLNKRSKVL